MMFKLERHGRGSALTLLLAFLSVMGSTAQKAPQPALVTGLANTAHAQQKYCDTTFQDGNTTAVEGIPALGLRLLACNCSFDCFVAQSQRTENPARYYVSNPYLPEHGFGAQFLRGIVPGIANAAITGRRLSYGPLPAKWVNGCEGHTSASDIFRHNLTYDMPNELIQQCPANHWKDGEENIGDMCCASASPPVLKGYRQFCLSMAKIKRCSAKGSMAPSTSNPWSDLRAQFTSVCPLGLDSRKLLLQAAAKYMFQFQPFRQLAVDEAFNRFNESMGQKKHILGVHLRGTDHRELKLKACGCTDQSSCDVSKCSSDFQVITRALQKHECGVPVDAIFIAGDNLTHACAVAQDLKKSVPSITIYLTRDCKISASTPTYGGIGHRETCNAGNLFAAEINIFASQRVKCYLGPSMSTHYEWMRILNPSGLGGKIMIDSLSLAREVYELAKRSS